MSLCKNRFRKFLPVVALLVGATLFGAPTQAQAAYSARVYDDGVLVATVAVPVNPGDPGTPTGTPGVFVIAVGNNLIFGGSTPHFDLTNGSGLSNNPGTQGGSNLNLSSNEQIRTTFGAAGGTHSIRIELSQTGWNAPTGTPLTLSSSGGGSFDYLQGTNLSATQSVAITYQGFLDNTNTLFGQPGAGSTPTQTANVSRTTVGSTGFRLNPDPSVNTLVPGGTPFSMTDVLTFTFTLDAGSGQTTANVSASSVASVPAPAGLVLALSGLPVLGIGTWLRRRRQSV